MTIGIYLLGFTGTHKVYIGQSRNSIEKRFTTHIRELRNRTHSKKMNEAYELYGLPELEIMEVAEVHQLDLLENYHIQLWDSVANGFNTLDESRNRSDCSGESHGNSKYSNEKIIEVFNMLVKFPEYNYTKVSYITNVSGNVIKDIANLRSHKWLKALFAEEYQILEGIQRSVNNQATATERGQTYPLLKSPEGGIFKVEKIADFAKTHNICRQHLNSVLLFKRKSVQGWTRSS